MADSWSKIDRDLQKKLKGYKYSFADAIKMLGINERTLRRYMDKQLLHPLKVSDEWKFTDEIIEKAKFMVKCGNPIGIQQETIAGIYDFLVDKGIKFTIDEFKDYAQKYW